MSTNELSYSPLLIEGVQPKKRYKNVSGLTLRIIVLCLSSFYFGYSLTTLSNFTQSELIIVK